MRPRYIAAKIPITFSKTSCTTQQIFPVAQFAAIKQQLLHWAAGFSPCCFFDNHLYSSNWQQQECLLGAGAVYSTKASAGEALNQLKSFLKQHPHQWVFGHVGYGIQAELGGGTSPWPNRDGFADLEFFVPQVVVRLAPNQVEIICHTSHSSQPWQVWQQIMQTQPTTDLASSVPVHLEPKLSKAQYTSYINLLLGHIARGDCYEINYCHEFFAEKVQLDPLQLYQRLSAASPNPFACYYRQQQSHLLCASPERYIMRKDQAIYSQPIKGTAARSAAPEADHQARLSLRASPKERAENVMVVDLVRNDLSRICEAGTVKVDELFGIYSFPQVYQMISTISGKLLPETDLSEVLSATFPMGSMTGAPKPRVMALINEYEQSQRGIFSGAVGYLQPNGNFDFNVVIRSLMYNSQSQYLGYLVGGGITDSSLPEAEYAECILKAAAIEQVLVAL